ncbi:hypothetical protein K439DRAFT_1348499 [Ramaria rubella]|nr:hypothetical protein K439DRAFT_1348499 [Ramaria rubella]
MSTSDPRDRTLEVPLTMPKAWGKDAEGLSAISMLLSGGVMVTRNRYLAWPGILVAVAGYINGRPLRQKDGGQGLSGILFAMAAMLSAYLPLLFLPPLQGNQVPLPTN